MQSLFELPSTSLSDTIDDVENEESETPMTYPEGGDTIGSDSDISMCTSPLKSSTASGPAETVVEQDHACPSDSPNELEGVPKEEVIEEDLSYSFHSATKRKIKEEPGLPEERRMRRGRPRGRPRKRSSRITS